MASSSREKGPTSNIKHEMKRSFSPENIESLSKDELVSRLNEMKLYVEELENRSENRTEEDRLRQHQTESQRRENVLFMRLTAKEQEVQEFLGQLDELRTSLGGGLRNALLDPVVNSIFQKMREEMKQMKEKMEQSQDELNAWKFTPDSTTGKRLMAKCKSLISENEELGKMMESGRFAQLEGELKLSKEQNVEFAEGQAEVDEFLVELDEDMVGLQATVVYLQKQLETARSENERLREMLETGNRDSAATEGRTARAEALRTTSGIGEKISSSSEEQSMADADEQPPALSDTLTRHAATAVRRHEKKAGKQRRTAGQSAAAAIFADGEKRRSKDSATSKIPSGETAAAGTNGTTLKEEETEVVENGRTPTPTPMEEEEPAPTVPVSPPPRKMPRLETAGSAGQYSPKRDHIKLSRNVL